MDDRKTVLEVNHIVKVFPGVRALDDVSFRLYEGEILSIVGGNGAGKSTLMKILSGEHEQSTYTGTILLDGKEVHITSNRMAEELGIAMIYQEINVELDLTVAENILLGRLPMKRAGIVDWKKTERIAAEALAQMDVEIDVKQKMRTLNASVQQIVCIARALVRNPKILILDEPTSALTESETNHLMEILYRLKNKGIACIYISHKLDEVFKLSDRIMVMRDSHVISTHEHGSFDSDRIIEDMIGRRIDSLYPDMSGRSFGEEMLRIEDFTIPKSGTNENILENVSFSLRKGEVVGLVGLVGSGRTELLKSIFGAMDRKGGSVFLEGRQVSIRQPSDAISLGIGYLTEERKKDGIIGALSVGENIVVSILDKLVRMLHIDHARENGIVDNFFSELAIKAPSAKTRIVTLSGGNQQKALLGRMLATDLKVLFMDEPTRGIDIGTKSEIYKIIKQLSEKGMSIVMISSEFAELLAVCDRFVVLGNKKVVGEYPKEGMTENRLISLASFGS